MQSYSFFQKKSIGKPKFQKACNIFLWSQAFSFYSATSCLARYTVAFASQGYPSSSITVLSGLNTNYA